MGFEGWVPYQPNRGGLEHEIIRGCREFMLGMFEVASTIYVQTYLPLV